MDKGLWLLHELTRTDVQRLAPDALAVFPVGAVEQHGPHLPTGTDYFAVRHLAHAAAKAAAKQVPVVIAPTLPFGSSHHHLPFSGTMSIATETYYRVIRDLTESLIIDGFRRIFILNGHGGNDELIQLAARDLALKHPVRIGAASYWNIAWEALVAEQAHVPGLLPGHAGAFETSLVMALRPELVREPRPSRPHATGSNPKGSRGPYRFEVHGFWQDIDGYTDSPDRGDGARGRTYLSAAAEAVAAAFLEFYGRGA